MSDFVDATVMAMRTLKPKSWLDPVPILQGENLYEPDAWAIAADWCVDNLPVLEKKVKLMAHLFGWLLRQIERPSMFGKGHVLGPHKDGREIDYPYPWRDTTTMWTVRLEFKRNQVELGRVDANTIRQGLRPKWWCLTLFNHVEMQRHPGYLCRRIGKLFLDSPGKKVRGANVLYFPFRFMGEIL